ncbi:MAG TPA: sensor histidine kinase [Phenylobacterium sp.]|uniref:sensor histidine kinase n=1 Tax=Phenylobacterium sp. TaxID=1871053 RepID=UPI002D1411ED|nr:sensor histidine kinase [Phenylobacterium sp.]HSV04459.1 sensor histidine kinase [Phenylobacterium sp.]
MDHQQPFVALDLARERETPTGRAADWEIRELNHRIANSLQLAIDVLGLQRLRAAESETQQALDEAMARLAAVGQLHRFLSLPQSDALVDLAGFLRGLCPVIEVAVGLVCEIDADAVRLPAAAAQQIGLLVNECAINARKHAYGADGGRLRIQARVSSGLLSLVVADEGPGLAPADEAAAQGLGTSIIEAILRQLGGRMSAESCGGARFTFTIPLAAAPAPIERSFARWSDA